MNEQKVLPRSVMGDTKADAIALFDMDGSLADFNGAMIRSYNSILSPDEIPLTRETLHGLEEKDYVKARMRLIKQQPGWWLGLEPIPDGFQILVKAIEIGFKIHVLTKGPKKTAIAWKEKLEWCQKYLDKEVDVHITSQKSMVYGKLLYDDYPDYMEKWLEVRPRGLGIMPVTPYNKNFTHPNVIKWDGNNYEEVVVAMTKCFNRKSVEPLDLG